MVSKLSREAFIADVDRLLSAIDEVHPEPYAYASRAEIAEEREAMLARASNELTVDGCYHLVAPLVASFRSGHTLVRRNDNTTRKTFPLVLDTDGTRVWLAHGRPTGPAPTGSQVVSVAGEKASAFLARVASFLPAEGRSANPFMIRRDDWLRYWLAVEYGHLDALAIDVADPGGGTRRVQMEAIPYSAPPEDGYCGRPPYSLTASGAEGIIVLEINLFVDLDRFATFVSHSVGRAKTDGIRGVILDLRRCRGGQGECGDLLLRHLLDQPFLQIWEVRVKPSSISTEATPPASSVYTASALPSTEPWTVQPAPPSERFGGPVVALVSGITYSSGVSFAQALRYYRQTTLIGETAADSPVSYGSAQTISLLRSGLRVSVATATVVAAGGGRSSGPLVPDVAVKRTPEAAHAGRDLALEKAIDLIDKGG